MSSYIWLRLGSSLSRLQSALHLIMLNSALFTGFVALAAACGMPDHPGYKAPKKTAITNVKVFDGTKFGRETTVVIVGDIISNAHPAGAMVVDAKGGYLIPGLIDSHCHINSCSYLDAMRQYGVTTALDMGTYPYASVKACRAPGVTDVYGSGAAGTVNGTSISHFPGFPTNSFIQNVTAGRQFVADRLAEGADYIKIILDPKGPDSATLAAVVQAAQSAGKLVITHAPLYYDYQEASQAGVEIPTHAPLDKPVDAAIIANFTANRYFRGAVPTLIMMQSITNNTGQSYSHYTLNAEGSVTNMIKAGVPMIAGSDANLSPYVPANPPFGLSMHEELELLVAAGLTPTDAIVGATSRAASTFRLHDRGTIRTGFRADLVLLSADPTVDIRNSRSIERVWIKGIEANRTSV